MAQSRMKMKRRILRWLEVGSYWSGLDWLFYWLNRKAKRTLCFHHVLPDDVFVPGVNGFELKESDFRRCIRELKRHFAFSNDLTDVRTITLTFDDGWRNQYETAARVLCEEGDIPAILFVAGKMVDLNDPRQSLVDELLANWISFAPPGSYEIVYENQTYEVQLPSRSVWRTVVRPLFEKDAANRGEKGVAAFDRAYPFAKVFARLSPEYLKLRLCGVRREDLVELRRRGWTIGWHSRSHYPIKLLARDEQEQELACPDFADKEVMAYPYGSPDCVGQTAIEIVRETGYGRAVSFMEDPGKMLGRFFLPRMSVPCEKYALHFELSGLKYFVKTRRMLPVI